VSEMRPRDAVEASGAGHRTPVTVRTTAAMASEPEKNPIGPNQNGVRPNTVDTSPTNLQPTAGQVAPPIAASQVDGAGGVGEGAMGITIGLFASGVFYLFAWLVPLAWIERYFLGHPVAVAATVLFSIACAILVVKIRRILADVKLTAQIRDDDLMIALPANLASSEQWLLRNDAGRVAKIWLASLSELPQSALRSPLVVRLSELLQRQSGRVSTRHLSDDLREISSREGDTAYDSFQLIRIIIWAIPMLGFLGTVIGITQTLGGLDFTDGTAAVDRLKSGLYVAFDTTALGLVLSVVAIFLQFPVERAEQQLLGEIDRRVGAMLAARLPSDDHADNPAAHIADLCDGIRVAVGQSLTSQAELWRTTIDEAHTHWQRVAEDNSQRIGLALSTGLAPVLEKHSATLNLHADSLQAHSESLFELRGQWNDDLADRWHKWNEIYSAGTASLATQHQSLERQAATIVDQNQRLAEHHNQLVESSDRLAKQTGALTEVSRRSEQLVVLQRSLDSSLLRLSEVNAAVQHGLDAKQQARQSEAITDQLSDAMRMLARAVDVLSKQLPAGARGVVAAELATATSDEADELADDTSAEGYAVNTSSARTRPETRPETRRAA